LWHSVHIDDIHPSPEEIPSVAEMHGKSVSALLSSTKERPLGINMEVVEEGPRVEEEEEERVLPDRGPTSRSTALEVSMLTITPQTRFI
jgi:hypothetical protein